MMQSPPGPTSAEVDSSGLPSQLNGSGALKPESSPGRHQPRPVRTLPPLSPLTFYRRNLARTLPVGGAIGISVFLIASIVTLLNSVDVSITTNYGFVRHFSVLTTQLEKDVPPRVLEKARQAPHLDHTVSAIPYFLPIRTVFGEMPIPVYGVNSDNDHAQMKEIASLTGNRLAEGRWPEANEPEIVLSRTWANNFGRKVGEWIKPRNERVPTLPDKQKLVGILEGGENVALADSDYLLSELPDPVIRTSYLSIPDEPQNLETLNDALHKIIDSPKRYGITSNEVRFVKLYTYTGLVRELRQSLRFLYKFLAIADALVIGAVALLSAFLANIYFEQRLHEFGLLAAFGFRRERLARRVVTETGILILLGWAAGLFLTWLGFFLLDKFYMAPHGLVLARLDSSAIAYTLPTPIIVGIASLATVLVRLYRLDPIDIMEHR